MYNAGDCGDNARTRSLRKQEDRIIHIGDGVGLRSRDNLSVVSRRKKIHRCMNGDEMLGLVEMRNCSSLTATNFSVK